MLSQIAYEWPEFATYYNFLFLAQAAGTTLALSASGVILGTLIGLVLAVTRKSRSPMLTPFRWLAFAFTQTFRRVPFLVTLMLAFFVFQMFFADTSLFVVAAVTTTLIAAAFLSEIIRAGLDSVHLNQWEAAEAMNFSLLQTIRLVILPQAWRIILPPAFGFFILFIKDTALASQIGVVELTFAGKVLNNKGFSPALAFGVVLVIYFLISYPLARLGAALEANLAPSRHRRP